MIHQLLVNGAASLPGVTRLAFDILADLRSISSESRTTLAKLWNEFCAEDLWAACPEVESVFLRGSEGTWQIARCPQKAQP